MTQANPTRYETIQTTAMNASFLRRNKCGHSSTIAVMNPSRVQNCESSPINSNMTKNRQDQSVGHGSSSTADGYTKNAKPGPVYIINSQSLFHLFLWDFSVCFSFFVLNKNYKLTRDCYLGYRLVLCVRHETNNGKDDKTSKETGTWVDAADCKRILVDVIVVFIVGAQSDQCAQTKTIRKEDLRNRVHPYLGIA